MTKRNWNMALASIAIAAAPLLSLASATTAWAQPPVGDSPMTGSPITQPTSVPTQQPKVGTRAMAAATLTRKYTRDPAIQVGQVYVENNKTTLSPGETVKLWIDEPYDEDSWTTSDGQSGTEEDTTLFGKWSNGATGYSMTWTAPSTQGQYTPKITVNDDLSRGSTNGRNDLLVEVAAPTLTVVKPSVVNIQYQNAAGDYVNVPSPLYVLKGTTVNFKAIPNFPVSWPSGKPVWGGSASGTGGTNSVPFNTVSFSSFSPEHVTAIGASGSTFSVDVVVYDLSIVSTPTDNFAGRSQSKFGLGETVGLSISTSPPTAASYVTGTWSQSGDPFVPGIGEGSFSGNGNTASYQTGPTPCSVTFNYVIDQGPSSGKTISSSSYDVIPPSGVNFVRIPGKKHTKDMVSLRWRAHMFLLPKDVSFSALTIREEAEPTYTTPNAGGYLNPFLVHQPSLTPLTPQSGNSTTGALIGQDQAGYENPYWTPTPVGPNGEPGTGPTGWAYWTCPYTYYVYDPFQSVVFTELQQQFNLDQYGTITVSKGGVSDSAAYGDPTSNY